jgi:hypothetical protein
VAVQDAQKQASSLLRWMSAVNCALVVVCILQAGWAVCLRAAISLQRCHIQVHCFKADSMTRPA